MASSERALLALLLLLLLFGLDRVGRFCCKEVSTVSARHTGWPLTCPTMLSSAVHAIGDDRVLGYDSHGRNSKTQLVPRQFTKPFTKGGFSVANIMISSLASSPTKISSFSSPATRKLPNTQRACQPKPIIEPEYLIGDV
eukprot:1184026-Prorocentrum_minimum.AAC.3